MCRHEEDLHNVWKYMSAMLEKDRSKGRTTAQQLGTPKSVHDVISYFNLLACNDGVLTSLNIGVHKKRKLTRQTRITRGNFKATRDKSIPNRWPSILPLMTHNLYWLKTHLVPCICLGLSHESLHARGDGLLRILPISSTSNQSEIVVTAAMVEVLTADLLKTSGDRTSDFVCALIKLSEWEMKSFGANTKWYSYPDFIIKLLKSSGAWATWRNQTERMMRGKGERKQQYLDCLVDESKCKADEDPDVYFARFVCKLPWDDEPLLEEEDDENDVSADESSASEDDSPIMKRTKQKIETRPAVKIVKVETRPAVKVETRPAVKIVKVETRPAVKVETRPAVKIEARPTAKAEATLPRESIVPKDPFANRRSALNLYWIGRSKLPCIFYDEKASENENTFRVLPVCCTTYHCECLYT
jgi:hypothetical protein